MSKRVLVALCTATGLLAPAGLAAVAPVTAYAATNTVLHVGARGSEVAQLQRRLNTLGFHAGTVDGVFGSTTATAVRAFQRSRHLVPDGIVGQTTWSALGNAGSASGSTKDRAPASTLSSRGGSLTSIPRFPGRLIQFGRRGTDVKEVQTQLNHLGYHCGTADGVYGSQTFAAIRAFQRAHHLTQDGVVGQSTWPILFGAKSSPPPKPTPPSSRGGSPQPVAYAVYDYFGNKLGSSASLSAAEGLAKQHPASVVKDVTGKVLYYQTGYVAYQDPAHVLGVYPYYGTAKSAAGNSGFVVNDYHKVDWLPSNYYYLNGGSWTSTVYGVLGTQAPPSNMATAGIRYLPADVNPGHSPHSTKFYPFEAADGSYIGSSSKYFVWENTDRTLDLTTPSAATQQAIDGWLQGKNSPLNGLGASFIDAQNYYGSNATYLFSHAIIESAWGGSPIALNKNNLYGYGAYDSNPGNDAGIFPTSDYAVHYESWFIRNVYLNSGGSEYYNAPNLDGMNEHYATDPVWSAAIAAIMNDYSSQTGQVTQSTKTVIEPASSDEPVYFTSGFLGTASMPAYVPLQNGSTGIAVQQLQNALNANRDPSNPNWPYLSVDGDFGSNTLKAFNAYQTSVAIVATTTVDPTTWGKLFPTPANGVQLKVDQMRISMMGTTVTEIYHVNGDTNGGTESVWVDAPYITFKNVYRIEPVSGVPHANNSNVPVLDSQGNATGTSIHAGDYVSASSTTASGGLYQIGYTTNLQGGHATVEPTGYISSAAYRLVPYNVQLVNVNGNVIN